jgi:hypothetical protein
VIVSVHQPNFLPYSRILEKIRQSDKFIILTHAQFVKGNYHNRFNVGDEWHTMSVNRGIEPLVDKCYTNSDGDWDRIKRRLPDYRSELELFDDLISSNLVKTNVDIIRRLCMLLRLDTSIELDYPTNLTATERLVDLCVKFGATTYLAGASGPNYLDLPLFEKAGIDVLVQDPELIPVTPAIEWLRLNR